MKISILVDNVNSWALPYAKKLLDQIDSAHSVSLIHKPEDVQSGDVAVFLSCEKLIKNNILEKNKYNLVPHASPLPQGKGMSPLTWQIIEGKNDITITLFEAVEAVDSGEIYDQDVVSFFGHELLEEMREMLGNKINEMILKFLKKYPEIKGTAPSGPESFYRRRTKDDSEIDFEKTISEQFNLLRVVDNERYPAFFKYKGCKYILKIYKTED